MKARHLTRFYSNTRLPIQDVGKDLRLVPSVALDLLVGPAVAAVEDRLGLDQVHKGPAVLEDSPVVVVVVPVEDQLPIGSEVAAAGPDEHPVDEGKVEYSVVVADILAGHHHTAEADILVVVAVGTAAEVVDHTVLGLEGHRSALTKSNPACSSRLRCPQTLRSNWISLVL